MSKQRCCRTGSTSTGIVMFFMVLICAAVFISVRTFASGWSTSEGTRVGVVTKLSEKGILWKTVEGELAVGGANRSETWVFSDRDGESLEALREAQDSGAQVKLSYDEFWTSMPWKGATTYDITKVEVLK